MRLKHWQGYGCVNAKKTEFRMCEDGANIIRIRVTGEHEWGLINSDPYTIHHWLGSRFFKDCETPRQILDMSVYPESDTSVLYEIRYRPDGVR